MTIRPYQFIIKHQLCYWGKCCSWPVPRNFPNSELSWEESETINIGFDYGLFTNRIHGSFDYYTRKTTNMLLNIPIPAASGFTTALTNIGEVMNKGWELEINARNLTGRFKWNSNINLSFNTNTVKALGPNNAPLMVAISTLHNILMVGYPMYGLYLVQQDGILTEKILMMAPHFMVRRRQRIPDFLTSLL